jgi:hypothetical protein
MSHKIHDVTADWTFRTINELQNIALEARKSSKEANLLEDKLECRRVEAKALRAISQIAKIYFIPSKD